MKRLISICFLFAIFSGNLLAQSARKGFRNLSRPEKFWVMAHPCIAKKAFHCTERARFACDSLQKNNILKDGNGGQLDAFRHAYWMALLAQKISASKAEKLGKAHEKGNYLEWEKGMKEDSSRADSMMCEMDLKNNLSGIEIGNIFRNDTNSNKISLLEKVLQADKTGKLVIIKKNAAGQVVDENGRLIILSHYQGKWYVPMVLVRSDYVMARN